MCSFIYTPSARKHGPMGGVAVVTGISSMGIATPGLVPPDTAGIPSCSDKTASDLKNGGETLQDKTRPITKLQNLLFSLIPSVPMDAVG